MSISCSPYDHVFISGGAVSSTLCPHVPRAPPATSAIFSCGLSLSGAGEWVSTLLPAETCTPPVQRAPCRPPLSLPTGRLLSGSIRKVKGRPVATWADVGLRPEGPAERQTVLTSSGIVESMHREALAPPSPSQGYPRSSVGQLLLYGAGFLHTLQVNC